MDDARSFGQASRLPRRSVLAGSAAVGLGLSLARLAPVASTSAPVARAAPASAPIASRKRQLAFVLSHEQFTTPQLLDFAVSAQQAGFHGFWTSDHIQPWQEDQGHAMFPWITLGLLGSKTENLFFGTGVTTPTYRYDPATVAQAFASLGTLYPGRVFLGLGTGEALNELAATGRFGRYPERRARLVEAVGLMRQLWSGDHITFSGEYFSVQNLRLYDLPEQSVPVFVAGNGPKSARLAGEVGDGWITTPENLASSELHDAFREGALSMGKDPDHLPILVEDFVVVGGEPEANEAGTYWRFAPIGFKRLLYLSDPREIQRRAIAELPSAWDTWRDWTVSTDPSAHIQHIQGLWDAGATHVFVHSGNEDQMRMIDFYGSQVIPRLG